MNKGDFDSQQWSDSGSQQSRLDELLEDVIPAFNRMLEDKGLEVIQPETP